MNTTARASYREKEQVQLVNLIKQRQACAVVAPSGFGQQELIQQSAHSLGAVLCRVNLMLCANTDAVMRQFSTQLGFSLARLAGQQSLKKLLDAFKPWHAEASERQGRAFIRLHKHSAPHSDSEQLQAWLMQTAQIAKHYRKPFILHVHDLAQLKQNKANALLEIFYQSQKNQLELSVIFTSSYQHSLNELLHDGPFAQACQRLSLGKPSLEAYQQYLQARGLQLTTQHLQRIVKHSAYHPFYTQYLIEHCPQASPASIDASWFAYVKHYTPHFVSLLQPLSNNQKSLIHALAHHPTNQPYAKAYLFKTQLTIASQKQAMSALLHKDLVYQDPLGVYHVLDPAVRSFINMQ